MALRSEDVSPEAELLEQLEAEDQERVEAAEAALLEFLRGESAPVPVGEALERIEAQTGLNRALVREALTRLLYRQVLELDLDRRLVAAA